MRKILFLCHGNICRSPMAEYIFKNKIEKLGLQDEFEVYSKALSSEEIGNDIYPPAKRCMEKHGIKYEHRSASKFNLNDYSYYDEIYLMDDSNLRLMSYFTDDPDKKVKLLNGHIEDPWYTDNYDKVFGLIEEGINKIIGNDI